METDGTDGGAGGSVRNDKGQWPPGVCGNPKGRPRKKAAVPKSLTDHLADAMMDDIPMVGPDGKMRMVPAFEAVALHAVRSMPGSKPREFMSTLKWMEGLGVFETMQRRAGTWPEELTMEQVRERLEAQINEYLERHPRE